MQVPIWLFWTMWSASIISIVIGAHRAIEVRKNSRLVRGLVVQDAHGTTEQDTQQGKQVVVPQLPRQSAHSSSASDAKTNRPPVSVSHFVCILSSIKKGRNKIYKKCARRGRTW
jgi:hypothetical protein